MAFMKKKTESGIGLIEEHAAAFLYVVKQGKTKFAHKREVSDIFLDMEANEYLLQQATSGTMYDYHKKIERNVWSAAMHVYGEDIAKLKAALLRAVDDCEAEAADGMTAAERFEAEEAKRKEEEEKLSLREQMELAEQREKEEDEARRQATEQYEEEKIQSENTEAMTEADCRDLWRIYQELLREYKAMDELAGRWLNDHPQKGCLGVTLAVLSLPVLAGYGIFQVLQ